MSLPIYPAYKASGVEWLGDVPEHWDVLPTKRLFKLVVDPAPNNNDFELLSIYTDIGVRPRKELEEKGNRASTTDGYWRVKKGDLIVNKLLAWMGAIGVSNYDGVTSPAYDILRQVRSLSPQFYDYLFRCGICFTEFRRYSRGIMDMRLRLYFDDLGQLLMPYPPPSEQIAITEFLDRETAKIDALVAEQRRLIELLKEKRQAVISHAVTKGLDPNAKMKPSGIEWLGDVPEHWTLTRLGFHCTRIGSGKTPFGGADVYVDEGILFLRSQNVYDEGLKLGDAVYISAEVDAAMQYSRVEPGDLLLNITGASLGRSCLVPQSFEKANVNQHVCVIRLRDKSLGEFVALALRSNLCQAQFAEMQNGAAREGLNFQQISKLVLALPPREIVDQIVSNVHTRLGRFDRVVDELSHGLKLLNERRTALISAAVTGKIDVRHLANQEAA